MSTANSLAAPVASAPLTGTPSAGTARPAAHGRAVLIIDDETTLARNVAVYLERLGWATQVAGSAEEGLAMLGEFRPDVVLLDHNLPGMNGLEALGRIRAMRRGACVSPQPPWLATKA